MGLNYLGINISHDASVAYFKDNKLINVWYEDRYNYKKHWEPVVGDCFYLSILKTLNLTLYAMVLMTKEIVGVMEINKMIKVLLKKYNVN